MLSAGSAEPWGLGLKAGAERGRPARVPSPRGLRGKTWPRSAREGSGVSIPSESLAGGGLGSSGGERGDRAPVGVPAPSFSRLRPWVLAAEAEPSASGSFGVGWLVAGQRAACGRFPGSPHPAPAAPLRRDLMSAPLRLQTVDQKPIVSRPPRRAIRQHGAHRPLRGPQEQPAGLLVQLQIKSSGGTLGQR